MTITQKFNKIKYCNLCGEELVDNNWMLSMRNKGIYICKKCSKERVDARYVRDRLKDLVTYKCRVCGEILTEENWANSNRFRGSFVCKSCCFECDRKRRRTRYIGYSKDGIQGVIITHKRVYPEDGCEICHEMNKLLVYHHWDDDNPHWGLWLCVGCHKSVEQLEKGIDINQYWVLKEKVMKEWK